MHSKWVFKHFSDLTRRNILPYVALWTFSLLAGILLCAISSSDPVDAFRSAFAVSSTPMGKFFVCALPISVVAIELLSPVFVLTYLIIFLCGISHGFCGCLIYMSQGNAAWLLRPLLLFSASCSSVLMWWLLLQNEVGSRARKNIGFAGILSCVIYITDLFVVSPIVGDLGKYF